jgi:hypothetical protein
MVGVATGGSDVPLPKEGIVEHHFRFFRVNGKFLEAVSSGGSRQSLAAIGSGRSRNRNAIVG